MEEPGTHTLKEYTSPQELTNFTPVYNREAATGCIQLLEDMPVSYREALPPGYTSGWTCIDNYLQGIRPGEVTVITADTGAGKTSFALNLCVNLAEQYIKCWINSWEMKPEIILRKIASIALRKSMKTQAFSEEDSETFDNWCEKFPLLINPNTIGTSIRSLALQVELAYMHGVKVVLLDHLDYLVDAKNDKVYEAIDETIKRLHELAFAFNMHFLLICHPKQSLPHEEVGLHSIKGSSSIKQYADNIIALHRCSRTDSKADPSLVKFRILKNRMFGTEGTAYLHYQTSYDGYLI